jgi:hypothetical protein
VWLAPGHRAHACAMRICMCAWTAIRELIKLKLQQAATYRLTSPLRGLVRWCLCLRRLPCTRRRAR